MLHNKHTMLRIFVSFLYIFGILSCDQRRNGPLEEREETNDQEVASNCKTNTKESQHERSKYNKDTKEVCSKLIKDQEATEDTPVPVEDFRMKCDEQACMGNIQKLYQGLFTENKLILTTSRYGDVDDVDDHDHDQCCAT